MSHYDQHQVPVAYPPPPNAFPTPPPGPYVVVPPPPIGYPTKEGHGCPQGHPPLETTSRGDDFWKGCVAALCCCFVCDACCF